MVKQDRYAVWARLLEPYTRWYTLNEGLDKEKAEAAVRQGQASSDKFGYYLRYWTGPAGTFPPDPEPTKKSENASS